MRETVALSFDQRSSRLDFNPRHALYTENAGTRVIREWLNTTHSTSQVKQRVISYHVIHKQGSFARSCHSAKNLTNCFRRRLYWCEWLQSLPIEEMRCVFNATKLSCGISCSYHQVIDSSYLLHFTYTLADNAAKVRSGYWAYQSQSKHDPFVDLAIPQPYVVNLIFQYYDFRHVERITYHILI